MRYKPTFLYAAAALAQVACGNTQPTDEYSSSHEGYVAVSSGSPVISSPLPTPPAASPSPTPTPTPSGGGTEPTYIYRARQVGYKTYSITVYANRRLKVRYTPHAQDRSVAGTNFSPYYSKMGVFIKVGNNEQALPLLSIETSSSIKNFSSSFTRTCGSDDTCRQPVTIQVTKPNYDFDCYNFSQWCPYTRVRDNHPWNGSLEVETDDTMELATN